MTRKAAALAVVVALVAPARAAARSVQEVILLVKPAVVLIAARVDGEVTLDCGTGPVTVRPAPFVETGTGWFVDGLGWIVTNAHVVDPAHRQPPWVAHELKKRAVDLACVDPVLALRGLVRGERPDVEDAIRREASGRALAAARIATTTELLVTLQSRDPRGAPVQLAAEVRKFSPPISFDPTLQPTRDSGRDLALLRVADGHYPALSLGAGTPKIGDPIRILGFPGAVNSHELLGRAIEATVTNGFVSSLKPDAIGQDVIQTDAAAAPGHSGGPAVGDDGTVVGILTFTTLSRQGAVVQGFNFLVPARDVARFLADTPVTPGGGRFNAAWRAGLDALFDGRYPLAAARIADANRLRPHLTDVTQALADAEDKVRNPPPRPFPWAWATLGVTLVSVGAYGCMFGRRWWKRRFRIQAGQLVGLIAQGVNPVLIDARSPDDFETSPLRLPSAVRLSPADAAAGRIGLVNDPAARPMLVVYCTSPGERTSEYVAAALRAKGFRNVRILAGGLGGWANARLPVETKGHLPAVGLEFYRNLPLGDLEHRHVAAGAVICREGDDARGEAFLIHAGTIAIVKRVDGVERSLGTMGEGELFGQLALFRHAPRSVDAVAATDVELLVITHDRLEWLIHNRPQLTAEILKDLSELVVRTDADRAASRRRDHL